MAAVELLDQNDKLYVSQDVPRRMWVLGPSDSVYSLTLFRKHIQFQPFTPKDIVRISEVEVNATDLYKNHENGSRTTAPNGPLDGRMVGDLRMWITVADRHRDRMRKGASA